MRKIRRFLTIGLAFLLTLCISLSFVGCVYLDMLPPTKEELIPETLGVTEGFFVYYDNYRSLTDGTATERLVNDITIGDVTYTIDEYSIEQIEYMSSEKEIFYSIVTQKDNEEDRRFLWHYNYDTKESGLLCEFNALYYMGVFRNYLFLRFLDVSNNQKGVLYDGDLNIIQDGLYDYTLREGLLCKNISRNFSWWYEGEFFTVQTKKQEAVLIEEKYAYILSAHSVCVIDLVTGNYVETEFENDEFFLDSLAFYCNIEIVDVGDKTFFITYTTTTNVGRGNTQLKTGCRLWELSDLKAECIYKFPKKYELCFSMTSNEKYLNFETYYMRKKWFEEGSKRIFGEAYYDVERGVFVRHRRKTISKPVKILRVGDYEFYYDYRDYGSIFLPEDACYYLHRIKDGKDEIMQYYFTDENENKINPILFDDIHDR